MGTFIIKHWFIALPSTLTGLYLLKVMRHLYREKMNQAANLAPVAATTITARKIG